MNLSILGPRKFEPIAGDLSDLDATIITLLSHENPRGPGLLPSSTSAQGFAVTLNSHAVDDCTRIVSVANGGIEIALVGAGESGHGSVVLTLPSWEGSSSHTDRTLALLKATLECWPHSFACAGTIGMQKAIGQSGDHYAGQWIYYMPIDSLSSCLSEYVRCEKFGNGAFAITSPHTPNAGSIEDLQKAKRVRGVLDSFGLVWHSQYAIHGWPPDEEEWRHEEFISGAPRGRKYRVHCIDFDGYDSQRNVLLYAKLFRRLRHQRKEWGLRGWDGPVLNEAKRQVRAANGTQIEWHIGLEEPAARVRTLLADYTDFTESQLNVIYTPLSQALAGR
jgi:hypothetical protein